MLALLLATMLFQDPQDAGGAPKAPPPPPAPTRVGPVAPRPAPVPPVPPVAPVENDRPRARVEQDVLRGDWGKPSGKRVTLEDTNSIDDTLQEIADAAGWNVSLNTGRTGHKMLVLKFRDVPVEDVLRATLRGTGLVATKTGDIVVVAPPDSDLPSAAPQPVLAGFDKPSGKKLTADFEQTDVNTALRHIAKDASLSIVIPPGVSGEVNGHFVDVPVEDALRAVLQQAGLRAEKQGSLIVVEEADTEFGLDVRVRGLPPETREAIREAQREAQRMARDAAREAREALAEANVDGDYGRDRQVTGEDLVVAPGDRVRDVNVVRGNLVVSRGAVARDVSVVQGSAKIEGGSASRDVVTVLGNVKLEGGATARQVVAVGGNVEIAAGANVENDVIAIGGRVKIDPEANVGGSRKSFSIPGLPSVLGTFGSEVLGRSTSPLWAIVQILVKFVIFFVLGLIVLSLFPRRMDTVVDSMLGSPLKTVMAGLLGWLVMPLLGALLAITIVGIPLVFVQILAVIAAVVLGITALVFFVGRSLPLPTQHGPAVAQLAVGVGAFAILTEIPFLGVAVWVSVLLFTFGAVLRTRFGQPQQPLATTPIPPPVEA